MVARSALAVHVRRGAGLAGGGALEPPSRWSREQTRGGTRTPSALVTSRSLAMRFTDATETPARSATSACAKPASSSTWTL